MSENRIFQVMLKVPFHDLDPLNVVWHGNYLKYFDIARFGLFAEAGIDLYRYSIERQLEATIKIVIGFEIRRIQDNVVCTRGTSDQVAVKMPGMEIMFEIPGDIRDAFGV
jgi:acyl-CoA thioester hydrolase